MSDTPERPQPPEAPAESGELASDPGRPRAADEVDPELMRLPRGRPRIGWLFAASVVLACVAGMVKLWDDISFARQGDRPIAVESPAALLDHATDSFVEVAATPDRALLARTYQGAPGPGARLAPLFGTGGRVWVLLGGSPWEEEPTYREVYRGRLRELSSMRFHGPLRAWLEAHPPIPRAVEPEEVRAALAASATAVAAPTGDRIPLTAETRIEVREVAPDEAEILAPPTEDYRDEATWRLALASRGIIPEGVAAQGGDSERGWTYRIAVAGGPDAVNAKIAEARLFAARALPVYRVHAAAWGELAAAGDHLDIGRERVPWSDVAALSVAAEPALPAEARILLAGEHPARTWYVLPLFAVLGLFAALFLWALVRALRSR